MTFPRIIKYTLIAQAVILGIVGVRLSAQSLRPPYVYLKDFIQEYLLAKAVLNGVNPYLPLPELAARFIHPVPVLALHHPTPHPPPVAVLSLPLGLLSYEHAAVAWFLFEMACTLVSVYLLLCWSGKSPTLGLTILLTLLALGWGPIWEGMALGQLNTLLLLLLICAWQALRSGKATLGGAVLGCIVALKLMAWPIVIFLALRRNWRAVAAAGAVAVAFNLAAALLMGFDRVTYYYLKVGATVWPLYRNNIGNISAWAFGWRVFEGTAPSVDSPIVFPPLVTSPVLAQSVSLILLLALLTVGLVLATRSRSFDASFSVLVCVSLLVNPVAWSHYLAMASLPVAITVRRLFDLGLPKSKIRIAVALGLLLFIPRTVLGDLALRFAADAGAGGGTKVVAFAAGLITFLTAVAVLGLLWLVSRVDQMRPAEEWSGPPSLPASR